MRNQYQGGGSIGVPSMTPMVQRIMIACVVIWLAQNLIQGLTEYGSVSTRGVFQFGFLWQPFTYMWLHSESSLFHIGFNMLALWMFGSTLEQAWGSRRFLRFYLTCGIGAGFGILFWHAITSNPFPTLGASGAVYGLLTAFSLTWPNQTVMLLFPPIPIRAIYFIPFLFVMQILLDRGNVSHIGHLGGVIVAGFLMRDQVRGILGLKSLRYRWHRYRMRKNLRAVRKEEWDRRNKH